MEAKLLAAVDGCFAAGFDRIEIARDQEARMLELRAAGQRALHDLTTVPDPKR